MLRLITGLLILCVFEIGTTKITEPPPQNSTSTPKNEIPTKESLSVEFNTLKPHKHKSSITDKDVENIVKPFKFAADNKDNITTVKLKKSEPYANVRLSNKVVNRTNVGRSVDIDIDKFTAPVDHNAVYTLPDTKEFADKDESFSPFHSTKGDSTFEFSSELTTPKTPYFDKKYKEVVESLNKKLQDIPNSDFENTTFSKNYSSDNFIDGPEDNADKTKLEYRSLEIEKSKSNPTENVKETRTSIRFENKYNISTSYETSTPNEESNELHKDRVKHLLNDDTVNEVKHIPSIGGSIKKQELHVTTLRYSITKSVTEKSDSAIISNKIEGESTTTPLSTLPLFSNKPNNSRRGSIKFADYNKLNSTSVSSPPVNKPTEQTVEENQVVPVHVTAPNKETLINHVSSTTPRKSESESITTVKFESVLLKNNTVEPTDHQSTTVYIFVQPEELKDLTTIRNEINEVQRATVASTSNEVQKATVASTPRAFQKLPTTEAVFPETTVSQIPKKQYEEISTVSDFDERTTAVTSIPRGFSLPTTDNNKPMREQTTKKVKEITTPIPFTNKEETIKENYNIYSTESPVISTTETKTTTDAVTSTISNEAEIKTTFAPIETTTIMSESTSPSLETTTELQQTTTILPETTTILPPQTTTNLPETTTLVPQQTTVIELRSSKNIKFVETTEAFTTLETTTDMFETTTFKTDVSSETTTIVDEISTQTKEGVTTEGPTTVPTTTNEISSVEETSDFVTKVVFDSTPTKNLLENATAEEKPTEESKTTPTTSFNFVHIKNIDKNHTTLTPDELKPNEIYATPASSEPIDNLTTTTETSSDETTSSGLDGPTSSSGTVVAIIISCVGGICLIALAFLLIVMRNRQNSFSYGQRCRPVSLDDYSVDNVSVFNSVRRKTINRGSKKSYGNPAFEDPVCLSHPLNFPAISKFANNQEDVIAEFHDIPQIVARTSELQEGCETKNRYANVIPLPESRVFLNHIEGYPNSDYINANFVTGPKNIRKYYIACQAPMSNTVDDFWRMIWEQQSKVILMLTHLYENGIEKCFDYLPPSEVLDCHRLFGDYQVTLKKREVKEKYIISSIQLKNMVSNSWREVTHFWYMGWPEKGVPTEANSIIAFLIEARSFMKTVTIDKKLIRNGDMNGSAEVNPVVVHCSPGTGRTGAVITCDIAIREFEQTRQVDIPKIVYKIRRDRAGAVQTKEQYAFIYKVIDLYATKLAGGNLESI